MKQRFWHKTIRRALALGGCLLLAALLPLGAALAQGGAWSQPQLVSGDALSSWFPSIAAGPDGVVHIAWSTGTTRAIGATGDTEAVDLLDYSALVDGKWSAPNDIVNPGTGGFASRSSLVVGSDGTQHLLVRSQMRVDYLRAGAGAANSYQAWSEPRRINNANTPYYDELAIDSKGTLHAFWIETVSDDPAAPRPDCANCADLFYRSSNDNGVSWSEPQNISQSPGGTMKPQVAIDANDGIHVVWEEGYDTIVAHGKPEAGVYRRSTDGGKTWQAAVSFTLPTVPSADAPGGKLPDAPSQMTLGLFGKREPLVVYRSTATDQLFFQRSTDDGATWSAPQALPGVQARPLNDTPWDEYSMATDSAGNLHLVVVGLLPKESAETTRPRLFHLAWNGSAWSTPELVAGAETYPDWTAEGLKACAPSPNAPDSEQDTQPTACQIVQRYPEWPRAVISNGNQLHVAWFTRNVQDRYASDNARYQVWHSAATLDAPAVAPVTLAAATPPSATPIPAPTLQAATPEPTLSPAALAATPVSQRRAWEGPGLATVGMAAVPVLGFLALLVGVWVLRSRH